MATLLRRGIYHDADPYAAGNDVSGDRAAARLGRWVDHDLQQCLLGLWLLMIVTHWPHPKTERFRLPSGRIPRREFKRLQWSTVARLARSGYRIRRPETVIADCKRLGVPGIEFELKFTPSQRQMNRLAAAARRAWGPDWQRHVEIKMLEGFNWQVGLRRAHAAGFTTTLIRFTGDADRLTRDHPFVDHYRR